MYILPAINARDRNVFRFFTFRIDDVIFGLQVPLPSRHAGMEAINYTSIPAKLSGCIFTLDKTPGTDSVWICSFLDAQSDYRGMCLNKILNHQVMECM